MFGKLREKFTSWLKKPKESAAPAEAPKEKPKKPSKKTAEQKKETETPQPPKQDSAITTSPKNFQEKITESPTELITPKEQGFFSKLKTKLSSSKITHEQFDELFPELEITLLENNVALEVVDKIRSQLSKDLVGVSIKKSDIDSTLLSSLKSSIEEVLTEPPSLIEQIKEFSKLEPCVILFFGINGSGKTTTIAKLASYLKSKKISVVLAAADTFRAASIEQLEKHAEALKVPIIKQKYGSDPAAVAFDAISYAKKHKIKAVLIDTAGRMYTNSNLLKEMEKIVRVSSPKLKIFIGESITGNDAVEQARVFSEAVGIDGIILSKADIDEKAGTILSVSYITKKPIYFLGTGQKYSDLQPFSKSSVLKNLGLESQSS